MSLSEGRIHFEEAKKLANIIFSCQDPGFPFDIENLKEMNFNLELQRNQARDIFLSITKSLDSLILFLTQERNEENKLKPSFGWVPLISKKLANLLDMLSQLKMQAETEDLTFNREIDKSHKKLAELSKKLDLLSTSEFTSSGPSTMKFQNQKKLSDLEQEKREIDFQIEKLQEAVRNIRALQERLLENIRITGAKLLERGQIRDENFRKSSSLFVKLVQEIEETSSQEYIKTVLPLRQKEKRLLDALKKQQTPTQLQDSAKKFHLIFLVDTSKAMKGKLSDIEKSLTTLLKDRTSKDLYSLISFNNTVSIINQEKKIELPIEISLPKGENGNSAFSSAIDQAFDLFNSSSFSKYTPTLVIITDALKSKFLGNQPMKARKMSMACQRLQEHYDSFQKKGLLVFVSYFDPLNHQDLKKIARAANGDKAFFEGFSDNHDFLNCIKNIDTLSKILQDLDDPSVHISNLREREVIQSELDIVQSSIAAKMKLINGISEKEISRLLKEKNLRQENDQIEFNKVKDIFEKIMEEQEEEEARYKKMRMSYSEGISVLKSRKQALEQEITALEENLQRENKSEEMDFSKCHQSTLILINPANIDINKSLDAFRKCASIFTKMSLDLLNELHILIWKLGKIFSQLEDKVKERKETGNLKYVVRAGLGTEMNSIANRISSHPIGKENFEKPACEKDLLSQCVEVQELIRSFL